MVDLKAKTILEKKGEEVYIAVNRFLVTLTWTAKVDLDLMAFYKTKDGREGGIFPEDYPGGIKGSLKQFPYIKLNSHRGIRSRHPEEILGVSKLEEFRELYICAVSYPDFIGKKQYFFNDYDAGITLLLEKRNTIGIPLTSIEIGQVAVIAKVDNSSIVSAKLINYNHIMDLPTFANTIPGGNLLLG